MASEDLDKKSKQILEAIWKAGGEAETPEIKSYTGLSRGQISYRVSDGVLETEGLVNSRLVGGDDGGSAVRLTSLTDKGDTVAGRVMDEKAGPSLEDQLKNIRADMDEMTDLFYQFDGRVDHIEDRLDHIDEEIDQRVEEALGRVEQLEELEELVEDAEDAIEGYEEVIEMNREFREAVQDVEEANEVLEYVGLIEESKTDHLVKGPTALNFRHLWRYGVFSDLVQGGTPKSGAGYGPGSERSSDLPVGELIDENEDPQW